MNTTATAGTILINEMILPHQRVALRAIASWVNCSVKSYREISALYREFIDFSKLLFLRHELLQIDKKFYSDIAIYHAVSSLGAYETHHDGNLHAISPLAQRIFGHDHIRTTVRSCSTAHARKPYLAS